jgi:hypothetical protein
MPSSACPHVLAPGDVPAREPGGRVPPNCEQTPPGYVVIRQDKEAIRERQARPRTHTRSERIRPNGRRVGAVSPAVLGSARSAGFTAGAHIIRTWPDPAAGDWVLRRPTRPNARILYQTRLIIPTLLEIGRAKGSMILGLV